MNNKKIDRMLFIGFLLIPFNDFPSIQIKGVVFSFSFLWAISSYFIMLALFILNKINIKKDLVTLSSFFFICILNFQIIFSLFFLKEIDDIKPIIREFLYSNIWIGLFIALYSYLSYKSSKFKEKLLKISIYSFFIFGIIETLNTYFKIYPKNITKALDLNRVNPLSSESTYFVVNFVLIVSILMYKKKNNYLKLILIYFLIQLFLTFSTTGFVALIGIMVLYFIKNIKKKNTYKNIFRVKLVILITLIFIGIYNFNFLKKSYFEFTHQLNKVNIYISNKNKGDYSSEIRKKVKIIFGENLFKKSPINGVGIGGIYQYSKYNKIAFDGLINSDAKNVYWTILAEQGLIGFFNHFIYFGILFYQVVKTKNKNKIGLLTGMIVLLILFNAYNKIWIQSIWLYLALILSKNLKKENQAIKT